VAATGATRINKSISQIIEEIIMDNLNLQAFSRSTGILLRMPGRFRTVLTSNRNHRFLATAILLFAAGAGLCEAATNYVMANAVSFPSGSVLENIAKFPAGPSECGAVTLTASPEITLGTVTYEFLFWNIDATAYTAQTVKFNPLCDAPSSATAWYLPLSGGPPCPTGDICDGVATWAFSLNKNEVIPGVTPIASVTPAADWAGPPATSVSTTGSSPVTITAVAEIGGYGLFKHWQELPGSPLKGNAFTVAANGSAEAVAFFGFPDPDPCQVYRNEIAGGCSDIAPKACSALIKYWNAQLKVCETEYGELPPTP
jgi:hypothetical protein